MAEPLYADIFRRKKDSGNFSPKDTYESDLLVAINRTSESAKKEESFNHGSEIDQVFTESFCAGYIKIEVCASCMTNTFQLLLKNCGKQKHALAWRSKCMVEYGPANAGKSNHGFVAHETSANKTKDVQGLEKAMKTLVDKLSKVASSAKTFRRYAYGTLPYGSRQTLFMAMQCSAALKEEECNKCLLLIYGQMKPCCSGAIAAATLTKGCYMRYAHDDFRNR